jgi:hypothetical protein
MILDYSLPQMTVSPVNECESNEAEDTYDDRKMFARIGIHL